MSAALPHCSPSAGARSRMTGGDGVAPSIWRALSINTVKCEMNRRPRWAKGLQAPPVHVPAKRASRAFTPVFAGCGLGNKKMQQHRNLQHFPSEARQ
jgi:hypothetical protein